MSRTLSAGPAGATSDAALAALTHRMGMDSLLDVSNLDARSDRLPAADAVLCRDLLNQLSFADAHRATANLTTAARHYLLCSTVPALTRNRDISCGYCRPVNLAIAPFCWGQPVLLIRQTTSNASEAMPAYLGLWRAEQIRARTQR